MSDIKPFRGYIPNPEYASKVASLPYDVLSVSEAKKMVKDNPISFLRVEKSEIDFPDSTDSKSEEVFKKGAKNLQKLIDDKMLIRSETPCFYVYRQIMGKIVQTGLVAGASVSEYNKGLIKKHELTRKDKEDERTHHIDIVNANTGPVFLTYHHKEEIDRLIEKITERKPEINFVADDGISHTLWVISNKGECDLFVKYFKSIPAMYVADGHHRSAAASRVYSTRRSNNSGHTGQESYNHFLAVIFPDNQLNIMDYNRALKDLNGLTQEQLLNQIKEKFAVKKLDVKSPEEARPKKHGDFSMYLNEAWYALNIKPQYVDRGDLVKCLDVSILQDNILAPLFGINDPRTDKRIDFIGGIRGLKELEKRCHEDCKVAFALYPTGMDELMAIADADKIMPPKSTWFEPKLRSGMIVRTLD